MKESELRNHIFMLTLLILITLLAVEVICRLYLWRRPRDLQFHLTERHRAAVQKMLDRKETYMDFDSDLGWTILPNGTSTLYSANASGFRANRNYPEVPPENVIRISTYGDSFTHCDDVNNAETWQNQIEQMDGKLEVLNFGVPGYGPDQALLRFRRSGKKHQSHFVLIGMLAENVNRISNIFRPFYIPGTGIVMTKPRFVINHGGGLDLIENPSRTRDSYRALLESSDSFFDSFSANDDWYRLRFSPWPLEFLSVVNVAHSVQIESKSRKPYQNPENVKLLFLILKQFYYESKKEGASPIIIIFPGRDMSFFQSGVFPHQPLSDLLQENVIPFIEITEAFRGYSDSVAKGHGHYTAPENKLIAEYLLKQLPLPSTDGKFEGLADDSKYDHSENR